MNILAFVGHTNSVATTQLCHCSSTKAAEGNTERYGCGCVPTKLYLQKQAIGEIWPKANADRSLGQTKA